MKKCSGEHKWSTHAYNPVEVEGRTVSRLTSAETTISLTCVGMAYREFKAAETPGL